MGKHGDNNNGDHYFWRVVTVFVSILVMIGYLHVYLYKSGAIDGVIEWLRRFFSF